MKGRGGGTHRNPIYPELVETIGPQADCYDSEKESNFETVRLFLGAR